MAQPLADEIKKTRYAKLPFQHTPPTAAWGRDTSA